MNVISHAHTDDHAALRALLETAKLFWAERMVEVQKEYDDRLEMIKAFDKLPWIKRVISDRPEVSHFRWSRDQVATILEWLETVEHRLTYELTLQFDDTESKHLFAGSK